MKRKNHKLILLFNKENGMKFLSDNTIKSLEDKAFSMSKLTRKNYHVNNISHDEKSNNIIVKITITRKKLKLAPRFEYVIIPYNYLSLLQRKRKILKIQNRCQI